MLQYLRVVVPPTVEHSQIAPERIAAHLINGWENMVGEELAKRFSALAALSFITSDRVPTATDEMLKKFLGHQSNLLAGETQEERERLEQALRDMAAIIREGKLIRGEVAKAAFLLVSAKSPVIGGERVTRKQIYGLLHTPTIEKKLRDAFPEDIEREQMRQQLGDFVSDAFAKFSARPDDSQVIKGLEDTLRDPELNFRQTLDIFTSQSPSKRYLEIKREINKDKLTGAYLKAQRRDEIHGFEYLFIEQLGKVTFLSEREIPRFIRAIQEANTSLEKAGTLRTRLTDRQEELLSNGVNPRTINEALIEIDRLQANLLSSTTPDTLSGRVKMLANEVKRVEEKIAREMKDYQIGIVVDETYGERLRTGQGPLLKRAIILYLRGAQNEAVLKHDLTQLAGVDEDLQLKVLTEGLRLSAALRQQGERRKKVIAKQGLEEAILAPVEGEAVTPVFAETSRQKHHIEESLSEEVGIDRAALEEKRRRLNNERLDDIVTSYLDPFVEAITTLDLDTQEVREEIKERLYDRLRKLGQVLFKHPDIVRVLEEDYPYLIEEKRRAQEAQLRKVQEEAEGDTRTRR